MTSLLKAALEGELTETSDVADRDMIELKGPLSEVFSEALARAYATDPGPLAKDGNEVPTDAGVTVDQEDPKQEDPKLGEHALESQANDALAVARLVNDVELAGSGTPARGDATTVYGVAASDVKPQDIVEVSQDLAQRSGEDAIDDYVLIIDATQPSVNGADSSNPEPRTVNLAQALEAIAQAFGVKVYPGLAAFAHARLRK